MTTSMALTRGSQTRGADVTSLDCKKATTSRSAASFLLDHLVHVLHHYPDSRAKLRTVLTKRTPQFPAFPKSIIS